jgi:hypothetical protein
MTLGPGAVNGYVLFQVWGIGRISLAPPFMAVLSSDGKVKKIHIFVN